MEYFPIFSVSSFSIDDLRERAKPGGLFSLTYHLVIGSDNAYSCSGICL